jgi:hypothetical protein
VHFIHLDDFDTRSGADGFNRLAMGFDPVVDGNVAALQEPANGTETEAFKVKLECLPLGLLADPSVLDSMSVPARLTFVPLPCFDDAVFGTIG